MYGIANFLWQRGNRNRKGKGAEAEWIKEGGAIECIMKGTYIE